MSLPSVPGWDKDRALSNLEISEVPFDAMNGNIMGFAKGREISISPLNPAPLKTRFHEAAHVLLGHTSESHHADSETTPRNLREVEAEAVALLCCDALGLDGAAACRGYIQAWWKAGESILDRLGRNLKHLIVLLEDLQGIGVGFVSLGEGIDLGTPSGRLQLHVLAALAEFERARVQERVRGGAGTCKNSGQAPGPA